ncbi:MAG: class I SAM-dependent methyltransferase [Pseudonocardiaceae bacterium]
MPTATHDLPGVLGQPHSSEADLFVDQTTHGRRFLANAHARIVDTRATFRAGDARSLPLPDRCVNVVVSGLALNFVPDPRHAVAEFARVARSGTLHGIAAAYVWDYVEGMTMMRYFFRLSRLVVLTYGRRMAIITMVRRVRHRSVTTRVGLAPAC